MALRAEGLLAAMIPRELGGAGLLPSQIAEMTSRLAAACASTAMVFSMHQIQVACLVGHALGAPWQRAFLARVAAEGLLLGSATSEASVGGNLRTSRCALTWNGTRLRLEKSSTAISYGAYADALLATARSGPDVPASDQVLVVVERAGCELVARGSWNAMGMRGTCTRPFQLCADVLPEQVVPAPFGEIAEASMVPASHLFWAALWLGIAADAVDRARAFLRSRSRNVPGLPPGASRLVDAVAALQTLDSRKRELLLRYDARMARAAAGSSVEGPSLSEAPELNGIKVAASEGALAAAQQALLVAGFAGYQNDTPYSVARHLRDLYSAVLMIGNDQMRESSARMLLGRAPTLRRELI